LNRQRPNDYSIFGVWNLVIMTSKELKYYYTQPPSKSPVLLTRPRRLFPSLPQASSQYHYESLKHYR
jgi:hypothetical protein